MRLPFAISALILVAAAPPPNTPIEVPVQLAVPSQRPMSGRLIVFAEPAKPGDKMPDSVDANPFSGTPTAVAARDLAALSPGQIATVDGDADSVPGAWSKLSPGRYHIQAVLDVNNNYNYGGRDAGDVVSDVADVTLPGPIAPLEAFEDPPFDRPFRAAERPDEIPRALPSQGGADRLCQSQAQRFLGAADPYARLDCTPARLCCQRIEDMAQCVPDAWVWRQRYIGALDRRLAAQADERRRDPADDLGRARRKFSHRDA